MNRVRSVGEFQIGAGLEDFVPVSIANWTEDLGRLGISFQRALSHRGRHQSWPSLAPNDPLRIFRLTNAPRVRHYFTTNGRLEDAAVNKLLSHCELAREHVLSLEIERLQTNRVRINPPSTAFKHELVTKEIREPCITRLLLVPKDSRLGQDIVAVFDRRTGRNILHIPIDIEMILMPVSQKRRYRQLLHHGKLVADPESLDDVVH